MKFHWEFYKTQHGCEYAVMNIPAGNQICGLLKRQQRPSSVEFSVQDVMYFLKNPDYFYRKVLPTLGSGDYK